MRKRLLDYATNPNAFAMKEEEIKRKADSVFEVQVANKLISEGYHIIQQYPVGAYRLDIVVLCENKKVVIECDGERYHSGEEKIREDMQRQAILERIGWRFIRIRGSQFFKNPDETMQNVITQLNDLKIYPEDENKIEETRTSELLEKVKLESNKYLDDIQNGKEIEVDYKDILYALDTNKHLKNNTNTHNTINTGDVIWGPSQFRYMVLYSEGINRKDISEYFNVAYDTVKKSLQAVSKNYNVLTADSCIDEFKKEYKQSENYQEIINKYYSDKNIKTIEKQEFKPENAENNEISKFSDNTKKSQQIKLSESLNKKDSDLFINELNQNNIKIIDNREKSDIIWIIHEEGIQEEVTNLINKYNFKSSFERRGSIVTNNKAAWRVMCK